MLTTMIENLLNGIVLFTLFTQIIIVYNFIWNYCLECELHWNCAKQSVSITLKVLKYTMNKTIERDKQGISYVKWNVVLLWICQKRNSCEKKKLCWIRWMCTSIWIALIVIACMASAFFDQEIYLLKFQSQFQYNIVYLNLYICRIVNLMEFTKPISIVYRAFHCNFDFECVFVIVVAIDFETKRKVGNV